MERPLQIAFKNVESSESLETLIRERVERLQRFHPQHHRRARRRRGAASQPRERQAARSASPSRSIFPGAIRHRQGRAGRARDQGRSVRHRQSRVRGRRAAARADRRHPQGRGEAARLGRRHRHRRAHLPRAALRLHRGEGFARSLFLARRRAAMARFDNIKVGTRRARDAGVERRARWGRRRARSSCWVPARSPS